MLWIGVLAIVAYLSSILLITPVLMKVQQGETNNITRSGKQWVFHSAILAIVLHLIGLMNSFFVAGGQNFTLFNVSSLISVLVSLVATLAMLRTNTFWFVLPIVYCFSVINIVGTTFFPGSFIKHLSENNGLLFHIALALFSYIVFAISTLYALQLGWLDRNLKQKKMTFSPMIPSLMKVEKQLFQLLILGEALLTITLISGSIYLPNFFSADQIQKAVFSFIAWIIFAILLFGHYKLHWRGKRVIIYTISGMILLTFAYFGSRLIVM